LRTLIPNLLASDSEILAPAGAQDGVLSSDQEFWVQTVLVASPNLVRRRARLFLPAGYTALSPLDQETQTDTVRWKIRAPEVPDQGKKGLIIRILAEDELGQQFQGPPDTLWVQTVRRANLSVDAFIAAPEGAKDGSLSTGQPFVIRAIVSNLGQAGVYGPAYVKLDLGATGVTVDEPLIRPFAFDESGAPVPVDWTAHAPDTITAPAFIAVSIDTIPYDENSDRLAFVSVGQKQFTVSTIGQARVQNKIWIASPDGAKDGVLSTSQEFIVEAEVSSENASSLKAELVLPEGFYTENRVKAVQSGYDIASWLVKAPKNALASGWLVVRTRGYDANNSTQEIFSVPDSLQVQVVRQARVVVQASIIDPPAAADGVLSVSQEFTVEGRVALQGDAGVTSEAVLRLALPAGFTALDDTLKQTSGLAATWRVKAPDSPTVAPRTIRVILVEAPTDENTGDPAAVDLSVGDLVVSVESKKLEVHVIEGFTKQTVALGELRAPLLGLYLKNRGSKGANNIIIDAIRIYVVDPSGNLQSPAALFRQLSVRNAADTSVVYGVLTDIPTQNPVVIPLTTRLVLEPGSPVTVGVFGDLLGSASTVAFFLQFREAGDIHAYDEGTQLPVELVGPSGAPLENIAELRSPESVVVQAEFRVAFGNYPNPFGQPDRPVTRFVYYLDKPTGGSLRIYTLVGDLVWEKTFTAESRLGTAGLHDGDITWDGRNLRGLSVLNGVYVAVLTTEDGKRAITKVAVVK